MKVFLSQDWSTDKRLIPAVVTGRIARSEHEIVSNPDEADLIVSNGDMKVLPGQEIISCSQGDGVIKRVKEFLSIPIVELA